MQDPTPFDAVIPDIIKRIKTGAFLSVQTGDTLSVMTIAWASFGFIWGKSVATVVVRPTRYTFEIIEKAEDFAITVPANDMAKELELCGTMSGRECDKLKKCNLETHRAKKIISPVIAVPGTQIECRILYKSPIDPAALHPEISQIYTKKDFHTIYYGEIVECYTT
jgi:flavin reductase (DIM6/NTAB) family NADH-FMN oxidoreductase RutF